MWRTVTLKFEWAALTASALEDETELAEPGLESIGWRGVLIEVVVPSPDVVHERVTWDYDARGAVGLQPRIGLNRALSRPWSHSIRLFLCCSVQCSESGTRLAITEASVGHLSVTISSGSP